MASIAAIAGMRRIQFELANLVSAFVWVGLAVGIGAVPGVLIDPSSPWLLITPVLVPLITIGLSASILLVRRGKLASEKPAITPRMALRLIRRWAIQDAMRG
jgi:membrane protein DedA with SNARE-associated domain